MIKDLFEVNMIFDNVEVPTKTKEEALNVLSKICAKDKIDVDVLTKGFLKREEESSTGFGGQVAIPHAKILGLTNPFIAIARFSEGIEWEALDDEPVKVAIALVMPANDENDTHLKVISKFARKLINAQFIDTLLNEKDTQKLYDYIIEEMGK